MTRTNYQRGVEIERKIVKLLEQAGYVTFRTAGSHGFFDVGAIGPTGIRLIQVKRCKTNKGWERDFRMAVENLQTLPAFPRVSYEVWVWVDYKGFVKMEIVG